MFDINEAFKELSIISKADNNSLAESVNNATLKQVILDAAAKFLPNALIKNCSYDIHHLDYNTKNNSLDNISLMPKRLHASFHIKACYLNTQAKKDLLFNNGGYADKCIKIGALIKSLSVTCDE